MKKQTRKYLQILFLLFILVLVYIGANSLKDKYKQDPNNYKEDISLTNFNIYKPSSYDITEWKSCESAEVKIKLSHPKEIECDVYLHEYSLNKERFILRLTIPDSMQGPDVHYGKIEFGLEEYNSLDEKVNGATIDGEPYTTSVESIILGIKKRSNIEIDSHLGYYVRDNGPWNNNKNPTYYYADIVNGTNILKVSSEVYVESDTPIGIKANEEFEKLFKKIISTIEFK